MPPILEDPRWEPTEAPWREREDWLVERTGGWPSPPAEQGWTLPRPVRVRDLSSGVRAITARLPVEFEVPFEHLADEWEHATAFESIVVRKAMHPAYQRIIGMGYNAVPFILRRLQRAPHQWFWALTSITGEDPAAGVTSADGAAKAWLEWGRRRGLIID